MSHRRRRKLRKTVARVVLALAVLVLAGAGSDFAITAYQKSGCFQDRTVPFEYDAPGHEPCQAVIAFSDERLQRDGWAAMLAVVVMIAASVLRSRTHRRTKLLLLSSAIVVVIVAIIFTILYPVFARGT